MAESERDFVAVLRSMVSMGASDLHLKVGSPPTLRVDGQLFHLDEANCSPADLKHLMDELLSPERTELFMREQECDVAVSVPGLARFRVNLCWQRGSIGASFRLVPTTIPDMKELGIPAVLGELIREKRGLLLITGATGSGKSTTVASILDHLNHVESRKLVTIEDPIEYLHRDDRCLVYQREIGQDTQSFSHGLRHVLRQDPDVIMIGEIRDADTLRIALTAANTGHLVVTTLHTTDAVQSIQRVVSYFPAHEQEETRRVLADNLRAVVSQRLLPRAGGQGRVAAFEVMINTPTIKGYISDPERTDLIRDAIHDGGSQYQMQTFDQALVSLVRDGLVSPDDALRYASQPNDVALHLQGFDRGASRAWTPTQSTSPQEMQASPVTLSPKIPAVVGLPDWLERRIA